MDAYVAACDCNREQRINLRRMPEMSFQIDDSLDYIDNIDQALKGLEDPIKNPTDRLRKKK